MPRLLIANDTPRPALAYGDDFNRDCALWSMLMLWHIQDDDIVVLPLEPEQGHLQYIAELMGIKYQSLRIIVAPPGPSPNLSAERIMNRELVKLINEALAGRTLTAIIPIALDRAVAMLAQWLKAQHRFPGFAFASQGGALLANSKAVFRAIAAGASVPTPAGSVVSDAEEAEEIIMNMLLHQGIPVILKKEFAQGCKGNEVLSPTEGIIPNGGRRGHVLPTKESIKAYLNENWNWLTNDGVNPFIVEQYFEGSTAIFAEFNLSDDGICFSGLGEMQAVPVADAEIIPPIGLSATAVANIVDGGRRLSAAMHTIGYRGILSADAIVTPGGTVLFSEYNGRLTGSTHIYKSIGARIVGKDWASNHLLVERRGWMVPSFQAGVDMLKESGLAYNHDTKSGFILSGTFLPHREVVGYTVVAKNLAETMILEERLYQISPRVIGEKSEIKQF